MQQSVVLFQAFDRLRSSAETSNSTAEHPVYEAVSSKAKEKKKKNTHSIMSKMKKNIQYAFKG